ncbi:signal peptidase I [Candidatus Saccharibacteria bacterium]|nr:signal peptidase I [Candidatus Saccharibacteria bacterium]
MIWDMEQIEPKFFQKHPLLKDLLSLGGFIAVIILGTLFLNTYIYRSYNVVGGSMENTLHENDRVIVNRAAVSWAHFTGSEYVPERGQIIVFLNEDEEKVAEYKAAGIENPMTCDVPSNVSDQYIIKRVIAFPGERVVVKDGVMTIYNDEHPDGFVYDEDWRVSETDGPKEYTSGEVDTTVPEGELFVSGDNREGSHSWDSRNGLGTIPYCRVVGPVMMRLFPLDKIRTF